MKLTKGINVIPSSQDESRSISENSIRVIRRRFEFEKVVENNTKLCNYDKGEEGNLIIKVVTVVEADKVAADKVVADKELDDTNNRLLEGLYESLME
ncbi:hypothetical protein [Clostridium omnivorum]|uniref:Uncharacterized protein n=1 Tax=Clostridium omnivorum TaxID=1604902 RepID=A0ABQ5N7G2_9CLOT|nr:hypothetical protein [Clostridium sp. E14]GLC31144.1 hypothetical protein bsdE14_25540 [Clostridium sp. E14]